MAQFSGTNREFKRYIGPQLRNLVQQITRSHRRSIGACQHCGATTDLESAHVAGRDRNQIIDHLLEEHTTQGLIEVDLVEFEQAFKEEHHPLEKSILILCSSCHRKYDGSEVSSAQGASKGKHSAGQLLPISLSPSEPEEFKRKLLSQKKATIEVHYANGEVVSKVWNADRFAPTSSVFGNLRSRPEFRSSSWQGHGIVHVIVTVDE